MWPSGPLPPSRLNGAVNIKYMTNVCTYVRAASCRLAVSLPFLCPDCCCLDFGGFVLSHCWVELCRLLASCAASAWRGSGPVLRLVKQFLFSVSFRLAWRYLIRKIRVNFMVALQKTSSAVVSFCGLRVFTWGFPALCCAALSLLYLVPFTCRPSLTGCPCRLLRSGQDGRLF